jgi:hypothetical protein
MARKDSEPGEVTGDSGESRKNVGDGPSVLTAAMGYLLASLR